MPDEKNLRVWEARLYPTAAEPGKPANTLHDSMQTLGIPYVRLQLKFPSDYPRHPPEVLVMSPQIVHRYVFGGALCADLLTRQNWKPTYRVGEVLIQLLAFLQLDEFAARAVVGQYDLEEASRFFRYNIQLLNIWSWDGAQKK